MNCILTNCWKGKVMKPLLEKEVQKGAGYSSKVTQLAVDLNLGGFCEHP